LNTLVNVPGTDQVLWPALGVAKAGLPLQLTLSVLLGQAPIYRLYAISQPVTHPTKPGMIRMRSGGAAFPLEVYDVPMENFGERAPATSELRVLLVAAKLGPDVFCVLDRTKCILLVSVVCKPQLQEGVGGVQPAMKAPTKLLASN
jgi:hypothetical protein